MTSLFTQGPAPNTVRAADGSSGLEDAQMLPKRFVKIGKFIDQFAGELANIEENRFNIP
jgi:hypothetical protein